MHVTTDKTRRCYTAHLCWRWWPAAISFYDSWHSATYMLYWALFTVCQDVLFVMYHLFTFDLFRNLTICEKQILNELLQSWMKRGTSTPQINVFDLYIFSEFPPHKNWYTRLKTNETLNYHTWPLSAGSCLYCRNFSWLFFPLSFPLVSHVGGIFI